MSIRVNGIIVIDDSRQISNANNIVVAGNVTISSNGVISNVLMRDSPDGGDAANVTFAKSQSPAYGAYDGIN